MGCTFVGGGLSKAGPPAERAWAARIVFKRLAPLAEVNETLPIDWLLSDEAQGEFDYTIERNFEHTEVVLFFTDANTALRFKLTYCVGLDYAV